MDCDQLINDLRDYMASEQGSREAAIQSLFEGLVRDSELVGLAAHLQLSDDTALKSVIREISARQGVINRLQKRLLELRNERQVSQVVSTRPGKNKGSLLRELTTLVAAADLQAAERLLLTALKEGEDPDYLTLLGRVYTLQHRPVEGARAIQSADRIRRQQGAFVLDRTMSPDHHNPSAADLDFIQENARQFAPLDDETLESRHFQTDSASVRVEPTARPNDREADGVGSGEQLYRANGTKEPKRRLSLNPAGVNSPNRDASTQTRNASGRVDSAIRPNGREVDGVDNAQQLHRATGTEEPKRRLSLNPAGVNSPKSDANTQNHNAGAQVDSTVNSPDNDGNKQGHTLGTPDPSPWPSSPVDSTQKVHIDLPAEPDLEAEVDVSAKPLSRFLADEPVSGALSDSRDVDVFYLDQIEDDGSIGMGDIPYSEDADFDPNLAAELAELELYGTTKAREDKSQRDSEYLKDADDEFAFYAFDPDTVFDNDKYQVEPAGGDSENRITREERAKQKAVELVYRYDWPHGTLPLIQQIYIMSGWGATRVALERAIDEGLTPEELVLAAHIKVIWADNDLYWIAFDSTGSTRLSYHALSWRTALLIVRSFESIPQVEEIDVLLEQLFEYWYENATLRRVFKAFARYLWYRFGDVDGALPARQMGDFDSPYQRPGEEYSDLGIPNDLETVSLRKLQAYGVPQIKDPQAPSCYFSDLPVSTEEGVDVASTKHQNDQPAELNGSEVRSDVLVDTPNSELAGQGIRG
ncbi:MULTISPECIES: hypothetical protein [Pseudomonas]|uniref:Uncharacterized protein n=1 Tax=Pseudomonas monteilii TaxID=76759 RepID=A0A399M6C1_9PSED|nr:MULTISPECIES: hypothetical protein [Pseudomonas]MCO7058641.1 hypothetical protein [Pseudomonas juntendi]RII77332.1 hypothetical protein D0894_12005 [Pseudomonas monteilii]UJM14939.1 hypothetical protein L1P09_12530 [Pseudomonas juntendi]UXA36423.1 hypothetical protein KZA81_12765 [Pseudomonas juntendi]